MHTASGEAGAAVALRWGEAQAGRHEPHPRDPQGQGSLCHLVFIFPKVKTCSICTCCGKFGLECTKKNKEIDTKHHLWSCSPEPRVVTCPVPSLQTLPPLSHLQDVCGVIPEPHSLSVPEPMGPCGGGRQVGLDQPPLTSFTGPGGTLPGLLEALPGLSAPRRAGPRGSR